MRTSTKLLLSLALCLAALPAIIAASPQQAVWWASNHSAGAGGGPTYSCSPSENPISDSGQFSTIPTYGNVQATGTVCEPSTTGTNSNEAFTASSLPCASVTIASMPTNSTAGQFGPGVMLTTSGHGYIVDIANFPSTFVQFTIYKLTGSGGYSSIYGSGIYGTSTVPGDVWKMCDISGTITVYLNGVSQGSVSDSTYTSGSPGIWIYGASAVTDMQLSNFTASSH